jgi:hypothetical protein
MMLKNSSEGEHLYLVPDLSMMLAVGFYQVEFLFIPGLLRGSYLSWMNASFC